MKKSAYMNQDGTFKDGFSGCVLHMTKSEGRSEEMAKKICGAIAAHKMANRNAPLLNREGKLPEDGFYHAVPRGLSWNEAAGCWQLIDDRAITAMLNSFKGPLLVDEEHWSYDPSKSSAAMGWGQVAREVSDGIDVKIDLTPRGDPVVRNKEIIYLSPAFLPEDCEVVAPGVIRPMRLDTLGLTNSANMKGLLRPLTNRAAEAADATTQPTGDKAMKESIVAILGVPGDTADSVVLEQLRTLKNRGVIIVDLSKELGVTDETQIVNRVKGILADHKALMEVQVESDLEEFKDVIVNRDAMKKQLLSNRADTVAFLKNVKKPAKPALHNRTGKPTPETSATGEDAEAARANVIKNRAHQIQRTTPGMKFEQAWSQALAEDQEKTASKV